MSKAIGIVTGGAGFIGSHLAELLVENNFFVRILDDLSRGSRENLKALHSDQYELINVDISKTLGDELFENAEVVFHLAGVGDVIPSIENPDLYFEVNTCGTLNVLAAATRNHVKSFVYAASSSCYGNASVPTNENAEISLLHPYALSKYLGEQAVLNWGSYYSIRTNSICIFNAYGRRFKTSGSYGSVLGVFVKQALAGKPLTIAGDGGQTRDFVHVKDVCHAFYNAFLYGKTGRRYNVGSGKELSILELANYFSDQHIRIPDRPGEARRTQADISRAASEILWEPAINIRDGLEEILSNMHEWESAPLWNEESIAQQVAKWNDLLGKHSRKVEDREP